METKVKSLIKKIWKDNYKVYGTPRLRVALWAYGINYSHRYLKRLRNELGIKSLMCRRFKKLGTHVDYEQRPNLIKNIKFGSTWRADITYLRFENSNWVYLSTILDNQTAKILAHKILREMTSKLVTDTLLEALRKNKKPVYLHSDIGSQYTSHQY